MKKKRSKRYFGFTLTEVMTTVVIISGLAAIAIPNYNVVRLKIKNEEARRILLAIYDEQKDLFRKNNAYSNSATALGVGTTDSDLINTNNIKHFQNLAVKNGNPDISCGASSAGWLARLTSIDNAYVLYIIKNGQIVCLPTSGSCPSSLCTRMGFPETFSEYSPPVVGGK